MEFEEAKIDQSDCRTSIADWWDQRLIKVTNGWNAGTNDYCLTSGEKWAIRFEDP